ncbi:hypothetical protein [Psychroserpens damuponensis]|uniref:hypothetical protein n=1 Tax=Psychroserpens damuponensis TaxID=943936 RepID=UPI00058EAC21|nr:hypothetical protein [Psychroserpens damuponensis]
MAFNQDMQDLILSIRRPFIVYLPSNLIELMDKQSIGEFENSNLIDHLIFYDGKGKPHDINFGFDNLEIMNRERILKSNLFQLLDLENTLSDKTFKFLLDEYKVSLNTWYNFALLCRDDAKNKAKNYFDGIQFYLDIQFNAINDHRKEIMVKFGSVNKEFNINGLKKFLEKENNFLDSNVQHVSKVDLSLTEKQNKKPLLLSDVEADNYLLKHVFHLKIK